MPCIWDINKPKSTKLRGQTDRTLVETYFKTLKRSWEVEQLGSGSLSVTYNEKKKKKNAYIYPKTKISKKFLTKIKSFFLSYIDPKKNSKKCLPKTKICKKV